MLKRFLERLLELPSLRNQLDQLQYKVEQFQSDSTTELLQSRINQLEQQIEPLQSNMTVTDFQSRLEELTQQITELQSSQSLNSQLSLIEDLEQALTEKIALIEQQQLTIDTLIQRLDAIENQQSLAQPTLQLEVSENLPDFNPRLTLIEQQLGCSQPSDEDEFISVSSVFDLKDISTETVYFAALQKLVEQYNLPLIYPDRTFRGHKSLSRQEFIQHIAAFIAQMEQGVAEES